MSHTRYNVGRDLVDFWGRMMYDNIVNQPNHTNKYKNTTKSITQATKQAIDSNKNAALTHRLFKVGGSKTHNTAQSILH